jgi:hypothetical protein
MCSRRRTRKLPTDFPPADHTAPRKEADLAGARRAKQPTKGRDPAPVSRAAIAPKVMDAISTAYISLLPAYSSLPTAF